MDQAFKRTAMGRIDFLGRGSDQELTRVNYLKCQHSAHKLMMAPCHASCFSFFLDSGKFRIMYRILKASENPDNALLIYAIFIGESR